MVPQRLFSAVGPDRSLSAGEFMMSTAIEQDEPGTIIKTIGVGSDGISFIETLIKRDLSGPEFIAADTSFSNLAESSATIKIQLGSSGLSTDIEPDTACSAARQSQGAIETAMAGAHLLIIVCAIGEGTASGAAPVIAEIARSMGILTLAIVRQPFTFDSQLTQQMAEAGIAALAKHVDSLIPVLPDSLLGEEGLETDLDSLFAKFDELLVSAVCGLTSLLLRVALVCVDFEDIRTVTGEMGLGAIGIGNAVGEGRAMLAAERAVTSASLGQDKLAKARGLLVQIWGSDERPNRMRMKEINEVMNSVKGHAANDAHIIFGTVYENLGDELRVVVIACGTDTENTTRPFPTSHSSSEEVVRRNLTVEDLANSGIDRYDIPAFLRDKT